VIDVQLGQATHKEMVVVCFERHDGNIRNFPSVRLIVGSDPRSLAAGKASGTRKHKNFIKPML
jgi:hypothetical protein